MRAENKEYQFKLFIAGMSPGSIRAIENIREICDECISGKYELEVIDIYQQRQLLKDMEIIAVPTLVRVHPKPEKRIIGDMKDKNNVIDVLEITIKRSGTKK